MRSSAWLPERRRSGASAAVAVATGVVLALTHDAASWQSTVDDAVLVVMAYLGVYVVATSLAFTAASPEDVRRWADRQHRGSWLQRYVLGTAPGPGLSIFVGLLALGVAVLWLPGVAGKGSDLPLSVRIVVGGLLIATSWVAVMVSFAVAYHADDLLESGKAFDFHQSDPPQWSDYVYFAVMVSTTFGTTDVDIRSSAIRRTVTVHGILAFVFNTFILGAVVGFLVG